MYVAFVAYWGQVSSDISLFCIRSKADNETIVTLEGPSHYFGATVSGNFMI